MKTLSSHIAGMKVNQSTLSLFVNDSNGGIIDDLIITKISDRFLYLVSNASRQNADKALLLDKLVHAAIFALPTTSTAL